MSAPPPYARRLMVSAVAGQFLFGIILALLGTLFGIPAFTAHLGLDVERQSWLLLTLFSGQFAFTALAGRVVDRLGSVHVLAGGALLLAAALATLATSASVSTALVAALLMAAGGASVNAASNVLVSVLFGARRGPMLNVLGLFGAFGAVMVPVVLAGLATAGEVRGRLLLLGWVALGSALWHLLQRQPPRAAVARTAGPSTLALLRDRWVLALTVLLILDFGSEAVAAGWIASYTLGVLPGVPATSMVGVYWGALMAGRVVSPLLLARIEKLPFVVAASALAAAGFAAISVAGSGAALAGAVALTGLALAPIAPTIIALGGDRYERHTGALFGLMLSLGQLGGVIVPYVVGAVARQATFRHAMLVPFCVAVAMTSLTCALWRRTSRPRRPAGGEP